MSSFDSTLKVRKGDVWQVLGTVDSPPSSRRSACNRRAAPDYAALGNDGHAALGGALRQSIDCIRNKQSNELFRYFLHHVDEMDADYALHVQSWRSFSSSSSAIPGSASPSSGSVGATTRYNSFSGQQYRSSSNASQRSSPRSSASIWMQ